MRRSRLLGYSLLVTGMLFLGGCERDRTGSVLAPGSPVPLVGITDLKGAPLSPQHWRGRVLVLNLWATWCGPCREEMPALQKLSEQLDKERFMVVGLSVDDDPLLVEEFLIRYQITFNVVLASNRQALETQLLITGYPDTLIISPDGKLIERISGARDWDQAKWIDKIRSAQG